MTLGREVHDGARVVEFEQLAQEVAVAYVSLGKGISRIG